MLPELLMERGSQERAGQGPGLYSLGEAVAEVMARYDLVLEGQTWEGDGVGDKEAVATCVSVD